MLQETLELIPYRKEKVVNQNGNKRNVKIDKELLIKKENKHGKKKEKPNKKVKSGANTKQMEAKEK